MNSRFSVDVACRLWFFQPAAGFGSFSEGFV
jgi:hypothetical protein